MADPKIQKIVDAMCDATFAKYKYREDPNCKTDLVPYVEKALEPNPDTGVKCDIDGKPACIYNKVNAATNFGADIKSAEEAAKADKPAASAADDKPAASTSASDALLMQLRLACIQQGKAYNPVSGACDGAGNATSIVTPAGSGSGGGSGGGGGDTDRGVGGLPGDEYKSWRIGLGVQERGFGDILSVKAPLGESVTESYPGFGLVVSGDYNVLGEDSPVALPIGAYFGWTAFHTTEYKNVDDSTFDPGNINQIDVGVLFGIYERHRYVGLEIPLGYRYTWANEIMRGAAGPGDLSMNSFAFGARLCGGFWNLKAYAGVTGNVPNYEKTDIQLTEESDPIRVRIPMFMLDAGLMLYF